jgi:hypothetical protein
VRKKPHVLYWVRSLQVLRQSGGSVETALAKIDSSQSLDPSDQLRGPKKSAVLNLLDKLPAEFLSIATKHVDEAGSWEDSGWPPLSMHIAKNVFLTPCSEHYLFRMLANQCALAVFTDRNLSCRDILLGASPNCKDPAWARRLRNTQQSLVLLAELWVAEKDFRKDGSRRKRTEKDVAVLARMAALAQFIMDELSSDPMYEPETIIGLRSRVVSWRSLKSIMRDTLPPE